MKLMSPERLQVADSAITGWMARHGPVLLRISLGIVFLWFGILKFFPSVSPTEELATRTIDVLSGGLIPAAAVVAAPGRVGKCDWNGSMSGSITMSFASRISQATQSSA